MLENLADFQNVFGPLRLFHYLTFRCLVATVTALFFGFLFAPPLIRKLRSLKFTQILRTRLEVGELANLHALKKDTPTMGGLIIYISVTGSVLLWVQFNVYVVTTLLVYTALTFVGFADDFCKIFLGNTKGLSSRRKLLLQGLIALVALVILLCNEESERVMRQLWIPFYKEAVIDIMPYWFLGGFFFLVMVGSSNAINLTDGVDGLAIGCTVSVALVYAIMAYATGNRIVAEYLFIDFIPGVGELAVVCAALVGGGLAFLWYNAHPAEIFMGDTGSLALGGLIGVMAFIVHQPITLVIVGGVFVMEALSVILQVGSYKMRKKRIFQMAPIHHHFELKGWQESKVVIRFWILSLLFAIAGLSTLKLR